MRDDYLGHVYLCDACAERAQLDSTFLMIIMGATCEGCGTPVGYDSETVTVDCLEDGSVRPMKVRQPTRSIANCWQMWRNEMWPVALGIALQDFAGVHKHEFRTTSWWAERNGRKGYSQQVCRCGERRELGRRPRRAGVIGGEG